MIRALWPLVVAAGLGCHPDRATVNAGSKGAQVNDDDCPGGFAEAKGGCDEPMTCNYPEGACDCTTGSYCGGVHPSPEIEAANRKLRWVCRRTPPAIREDGCPGAEPAVASPCTDPTKQCTYRDCCIVTFSCLDGAWRSSGPQCPP